MPRRTSAALVATVAAVALAGCGDRQQQPDTPPVSPTVAPSPEATRSPAASPTAGLDLGPAEAAAAAQVLAVYERFVDLEIALAADPPPPAESDERLNEYTTSAVHGRVLLAMHMLHDHGLARTGTPRSRLRVAAVDLDGPPPSVTIVECFDTATWRVVDRGGTPVAVEDAPPELYAVAPGVYVRTVHVHRFPGDVWLLRDYDRPLVQEPDEAEVTC